MVTESSRSGSRGSATTTCPPRSSKRRVGPSPTSSVSACSSARPRRGARASPRSARRRAAGSRRRRSSRPGVRTLASRAALANGTMALGFEYADFGAGSRPYPFAVTGPLAVAEAEHRSGKELALAIVIGYEVMGRVFHATFERGKHIPFYVPSVYGTLAGAAGCARVLGLVAGAHQLRARPGGGVHGRHLPGSRGGCVAAIAERRDGRRACVSPRPSSRDRLPGHRARPRRCPGLRRGCTPTGISNRRCSSTVSATRS